MLSRQNSLKVQKDLEYHTLLKCSLEIFKIAAPSIIMCIFGDLIPIINFIYAGQLGDAHMLAGLGVGTSLLECLTIYILIGMNGV